VSAGIWSLVGRFAAIGLFFVTDMVLARGLTKADWGAFYLVTQTTIFLGALASLGTPQILSRTIRQTLHGPHPEQVRNVIRTCSRLLILGCLAVAVLFYIVAPYVGEQSPQWAPFRDDRLGIIAWACLSTACLNAAYTLQALDDFRTATLVASRRGGVLPNLLFVLFSLGMWRMGAINTTSLIFAQVLFQVIALLVALRAIDRQLGVLVPPSAVHGDAGRQPAEPDKSYAWYLKEGLPFLVVMLIGMAMDELDGLWVGQLVDDTATANYGAAKRLVRLMTMPYVMFGLSLAPFVAELLAKNEHARLERILRAAATLVSLPMLAALAVYLLTPQIILTLAFGAPYRDAAPVLQWLTIGSMLIVVTGHSTQVLLMAGRQTTLMYCSVGALIVYAGALYPTVRSFGVVGAAALQSISFGLLACLVMVLAKRQVGIWTIASWRPSEVAAACKALLGAKRKNTPTGSDAL